MSSYSPLDAGINAGSRSRAEGGVRSSVLSAQKNSFTVKGFFAVLGIIICAVAFFLWLIIWILCQLIGGEVLSSALDDALKNADLIDYFLTYFSLFFGYLFYIADSKSTARPFYDFDTERQAKLEGVASGGALSAISNPLRKFLFPMRMHQKGGAAQQKVQKLAKFVNSIQAQKGLAISRQKIARLATS